MNRKETNLRKFTLILSLSSILNQIGLVLFRLLALFLLTGEIYKSFSLTLTTFYMILPFSSFALHSALTRKIRNEELNDKIIEIKNHFIIMYWLTSIFSVLIFIFFGKIFFLPFLNNELLIFLGLCLIFYSFSEFYMGTSRGNGDVYISAVITSLKGLSIGIIALFFFLFSNENHHPDFFLIFIIIFGLGYIISFISGSILYKRPQELINALKIKTINKKFLISNFKDSLYLFLNNFSETFILWLLSYFAIQITSANQFKTFDLSLMIITFIGFFSSSLTMSINSKKKDQSYNRINIKKDSILRFLLIIFVLNILIFIIVVSTNLDIYFLSLFFDFFKSDFIWIVRATLLLPGPKIIASYFKGRLLNQEKVKIVFISKVFSVIGFLIIACIGFLLSNPIILILSLYTNYIIYFSCLIFINKIFLMNN